MARVAAISAGPRSASPRGKRAFSFCGFLGLSAMGGVGTSQGAMRQPGPRALYALNLRALAGWQHVVADREGNPAVGIQRHEFDAVEQSPTRYSSVTLSRSGRLLRWSQDLSDPVVRVGHATV